MLLVHLFVCFVRFSFCHFSAPLGVEGGCGCDCSTPCFFFFLLTSLYQKESDQDDK